MDDLTHLADLLARRNLIDMEIARVIGRPAHPGHIGEFLAARVFDIDLHQSASSRASDGVFRNGELAGRSVNIKLYSKQSSLLDMVSSDDPAFHPDFYLVMSGPAAPPASSRGTYSPLVIASIHLFDTPSLLKDLKTSPRVVKIGIATSVRKHLWQAAMIYPEQVNPALILSEEQHAALALFAPTG